MNKWQLTGVENVQLHGVKEFNTAQQNDGHLIIIVHGHVK